MATEEIPIAGYAAKLLSRVEVAEGTMAFHFEKPSQFDFKPGQSADASIRSVNHLLSSFALGAELATVPSGVLDEWEAAGFPMPDQHFRYQGVDAGGKLLNVIPYKQLDLNLPWESFDIAHELTTKGIQKFVADYQSTLRRSA